MKYLWYLLSIALLYLLFYCYEHMSYKMWYAFPTCGLIAAMSWACLWKGAWHDFDKKYNPKAQP